MLGSTISIAFLILLLLIENIAEVIDLAPSKLEMTSLRTPQPVQNTSQTQTPQNTSQTQTQPVQNTSQTQTPQDTSQTQTQPVQNTSQTQSIVSVPKLPLVTQTVFTNTTSFADIVLSHNLPTTFLQNQIFPFKGKIIISNPTGISLHVIFTNIQDGSRLQFSAYLPASSINFQILAYLNTTGTYILAIFVGSSGFNSKQRYIVVPRFAGNITSRPPTPISTALLNSSSNNLLLSWKYSDVAQPALTLITFSQKSGQTVQFLISNYQQSFSIPFNQFSSFSLGETSLQIIQAFSMNEGAFGRVSNFSSPYRLTFNATGHHYALITNKSSFASIPYNVPSDSQIDIVGVTITDLNNQIILLAPSNYFQSFYILQDPRIATVPIGTSVNMTIQFFEDGVYILQINDNNGIAVVNIPIYVGNIYPLIPDFIDMSPYANLNALNQSTTLSQRRQVILQSINTIRQQFGASSIYEDSSLDSFAQNYSLYQMQLNYIGHIDLQGRTLSQRAVAAGVLGRVGQNIARNIDLAKAQLMLQRSPAHLRNMVNPIWTRVGLGIAQNNQYYYLTQQFSQKDFSLYPPTANQLNQIAQAAIDSILAINFYLQQDKALSWLLKSYQALNSRPNITSYLRVFGQQNLRVVNVNYNLYNGQFLQPFSEKNEQKVAVDKYTKFGLSVAYLNGMLQILSAFK